MRAKPGELYVFLAWLQPVSEPVTLVRFLATVLAPAPPEAEWMRNCSY